MVSKFLFDDSTEQRMLLKMERLSNEQRKEMMECLQEQKKDLIAMFEEKLKSGLIEQDGITQRRIVWLRW